LGVGWGLVGGLVGASLGLAVQGSARFADSRIIRSWANFGEAGNLGRASGAPSSSLHLVDGGARVDGGGEDGAECRGTNTSVTYLYAI
jgi:hypothetical protein